MEGYVANKNIKKKKVSRVKIVILLLIIGAVILSKANRSPKMRQSQVRNTYITKNINVEEYSKNSLYAGKGQEKIEGKDGYDTTFTTVDGKVYKEYKQNGNASWKNKDYWGGTFEENGCGLAALATISSAYEKKYTPEDLRKKYKCPLVIKNNMIEYRP